MCFCRWTGHTVWNWFHRLGAPKSFYEISGYLVPLLGTLAALTLLTGVVWALAFVPADYQQGNTVRIMYIHVPSAIVAQSSYMMMAIAGIVFLIWRIKLADVALECAAPVGATLTLLALATGAIWGKPTWGTWWVWDARLTSTLVLLFLFLGVMALRSAMSGRESAGRAAAMLAIVGLVNLPIIKYSVDWWFTLHQPSSLSLMKKPAMPPEMFIPLLVMVLGFYLFFFAIWMMRIRAEILEREQRTGWVRELLAGEHAR
ncbi:MAG: heme ABC transporter permease CcmC [Proteobacteria bacterium]|nr:heme ABC transporter permease CcmC [Pseudomonadota bacterium]